MSGCTTQKEIDTPTPSEEIVNLPIVSGAKAATYAISLLNGPSQIGRGIRPSMTLGIYASTYLAQGAFLPVQSAIKGILAQQKILAGQQQPESSETFSLLKEFGSILQVNIMDILNRSTNREEALEKYLRSLANITELAQRKMDELEALKEQLKEERKEKRDQVRDIERSVRNALKEEDYEFVGIKQEELSKANVELAEIEIKEEQTRDILKPYGNMMKIAKERYNAIVQNRRVLLAGLKVVEVPGVEDLDILEETKVWERSKRKREGETVDDPLGTKKINIGAPNILVPSIN